MNLPVFLLSFYVVYRFLKLLRRRNFARVLSSSVLYMMTFNLKLLYLTPFIFIISLGGWRWSTDDQSWAWAVNMLVASSWVFIALKVWVLRVHGGVSFGAFCSHSPISRFFPIILASLSLISSRGSLGNEISKGCFFVFWSRRVLTRAAAAYFVILRRKLPNIWF